MWKSHDYLKINFLYFFYYGLYSHFLLNKIMFFFLKKNKIRWIMDVTLQKQ